MQAASSFLLRIWRLLSNFRKLLFSGSKSDPVSWDTELARMSVTKEAGPGDESEEAGIGAGAVECTERH